MGDLCIKIDSPSPVTATTGSETTQIIFETGDSSKPISVYANHNIDDAIVSSTAGANINIENFSLNLSVGLDNTGIYGSLTNDGKTESLGIRLNLSELKIGLEHSATIQWDNKTKTAYSNVSISGWFIVGLYAILTAGQPMQQLTPA